MVYRIRHEHHSGQLLVWCSSWKFHPLSMVQHSIKSIHICIIHAWILGSARDSYSIFTPTPHNNYTYLSFLPCGFWSVFIHKLQEEYSTGCLRLRRTVQKRHFHHWQLNGLHNKARMSWEQNSRAISTLIHLSLLNVVLLQHLEHNFTVASAEQPNRFKSSHESSIFKNLSFYCESIIAFILNSHEHQRFQILNMDVLYYLYNMNNFKENSLVGKFLYRTL